MSKPSLGLPDALEAAREAARNAQEGNLKLCRAVDILRSTLEMIAGAEMDRMTGLLVKPHEFRQMAVDGLNAYSTLTGQSWKRHKLTGPTRAGDRSLDTLEG
jgi:hypothetical protein